MGDAVMNGDKDRLDQLIARVEGLDAGRAGAARGGGQV